MAKEIGEVLITITGILSAGGATIAAIHKGYLLLKEWIGKEVYKKLYEELRDKVLDSMEE